YVDLDGERFDIRAKVTSIGGYSAHADQKGLVEFVTGMQQWPTDIRIVHGEQKAKHALADVLRIQYAAREISVQTEPT
uniref:MBL fold metallo-hydrolase RNA specificity domain-containing protein n=1 Tax=Pseudomonas sp. TaxID=306 RepID=UPI002579C886